jgi:hypothetical protein
MTVEQAKSLLRRRLRVKVPFEDYPAGWNDVSVSGFVYDSGAKDHKLIVTIYHPEEPHDHLHLEIFDHNFFATHFAVEM